MDQSRHPKGAVTVSASSTTEVMIYQDSDGVTASPDPSAYSGGRFSWCCLATKPDQDLILLHRWGPTLLTADASLVIVNGATGTGETVDHNAAITDYRIRLKPGRNKISIKTTGTPPTANGVANRVAWELNSFPGKLA
jgi:hypothetical protein